MYTNEEKDRIIEYLIDLFLQIESKFHCSQRWSPFLLSWTVDGFQNNSSSTLILVFNELLSMFMLLFCRILKELMETFQSNVITIVIGSLKNNTEPEYTILKIDVCISTLTRAKYW